MTGHTLLGYMADGYHTTRARDYTAISAVSDRFKSAGSPYIFLTPSNYTHGRTNLFTAQAQAHGNGYPTLGHVLPFSTLFSSLWKFTLFL